MSIVDTVNEQNGFADTDDDDDDTEDGLLPDGRVIRLRLIDSDRDEIHEAARARHASYDDGRTRDESFAGDDDSYRAMARGVAAEKCLAAVCDSAEFDESVSASGDTGIDGTILIGDEELTYDVKSSTYDGPGQSLMVRQSHVRERPETPDIYIRSYVDDDLSEVRLQGWIPAEEQLRDDNLEPSPAGDWINYDVGVDELNPMPEPDVDDHPLIDIVSE